MIMLRAIVLIAAVRLSLRLRRPLQPDQPRARGLPQHLQRTAGAAQLVAWNGKQAPGTVVVSTSQRQLYYVLGQGRAIRYGVGVGRQGFSWSGTKIVSRKRRWPDWRPPAAMLKRRPDLPRYMAGGMENPLGARAIYLGSSLYPDPWFERARHDRSGGFLEAASA